MGTIIRFDPARITLGAVGRSINRLTLERASVKAGVEISRLNLSGYHLFEVRNAALYAMNNRGASRSLECGHFPEALSRAGIFELTFPQNTTPKQISKILFSLCTKSFEAAKNTFFSEGIQVDVQEGAFSGPGKIESSPALYRTEGRNIDMDHLTDIFGRDRVTGLRRELLEVLHEIRRFEEEKPYSKEVWPRLKYYFWVTFFVLRKYLSADLDAIRSIEGGPPPGIYSSVQKLLKKVHDLSLSCGGDGNRCFGLQVYPHSDPSGKISFNAFIHFGKQLQCISREEESRLSEKRHDLLKDIGRVEGIDRGFFNILIKTGFEVGYDPKKQMIIRQGEDRHFLVLLLPEGDLIDILLRSEGNTPLINLIIFRALKGMSHEDQIL